MEPIGVGGMRTGDVQGTHEDDKKDEVGQVVKKVLKNAVDETGRELPNGGTHKDDNKDMVRVMVKNVLKNAINETGSTISNESVSAHEDVDKNKVGDVVKKFKKNAVDETGREIRDGGTHKDADDDKDEISVMVKNVLKNAVDDTGKQISNENVGEVQEDNKNKVNEMVKKVLKNAADKTGKQIAKEGICGTHKDDDKDKVCVMVKNVLKNAVDETGSTISNESVGEARKDGDDDKNNVCVMVQNILKNAVDDTGKQISNKSSSVAHEDDNKDKVSDVVKRVLKNAVDETGKEISKQGIYGPHEDVDEHDNDKDKVKEMVKNVLKNAANETGKELSNEGTYGTHENDGKNKVRKMVQNVLKNAVNETGRDLSNEGIYGEQRDSDEDKVIDMVKKVLKNAVDETGSRISNEDIRGTQDDDDKMRVMVKNVTKNGVDEEGSIISNASIAETRTSMDNGMVKIRQPAKNILNEKSYIEKSSNTERKLIKAKDENSQGLMNEDNVEKNVSMKMMDLDVKETLDFLVSTIVNRENIQNNNQQPASIPGLGIPGRRDEHKTTQFVQSVLKKAVNETKTEVSHQNSPGCSEFNEFIEEDVSVALQQIVEKVSADSIEYPPTLCSSVVGTAGTATSLIEYRLTKVQEPIEKNRFDDNSVKTTNENTQEEISTEEESAVCNKTSGKAFVAEAVLKQGYCDRIVKAEVVEVLGSIIDDIIALESTQNNKQLFTLNLVPNANNSCHNPPQLQKCVAKKSMDKLAEAKSKQNSVENKPDETQDTDIHPRKIMRKISLKELAQAVKLPKQDVASKPYAEMLREEQGQNLQSMLQEMQEHRPQTSNRRYPFPGTVIRFVSESDDDSDEEFSLHPRVDNPVDRLVFHDTGLWEKVPLPPWMNQPATKKPGKSQGKTVEIMADVHRDVEGNPGWKILNPASEEFNFPKGSDRPNGRTRYRQKKEVEIVPIVCKFDCEIEICEEEATTSRSKRSNSDEKLRRSIWKKLKDLFCCCCFSKTEE